MIVQGFEVDPFRPRSSLVVELDGWVYHSDLGAVETDRIRDETLQRAGYRVIRLTAARLRDDPCGVAEPIGEPIR